MTFSARLVLLLAAFCVLCSFGAVVAQNTPCTLANPDVCGSRGNCNPTTLKCDCHSNCNSPTSCGVYIDSPSGACTVFSPNPAPTYNGQCASNPQICGPHGNCQNDACVCHPSCSITNNVITCGVYAFEEEDGPCSTLETCQDGIACPFCKSSAPVWYQGNCYPCSANGQCDNVKQTNLVSDLASFNPVTVDPLSKNAWGIAVVNNKFYVTNTGSNTVSVYDADGQILEPAITVPLNAAIPVPSAFPIGIGYNPADGKIHIASPLGQVWAMDINNNNSFTLAYDRTGIATFTGLTVIANRIINPNFKVSNPQIRTYLDTPPYSGAGGFTEANIPAGYAPYNTQAVTNELFVTYAKVHPTNPNAVEEGVGLGFVSKFDMVTKTFTRFATGGQLNAPWGITRAPANFGKYSNQILIGNFGDGLVLGYKDDGTFLGELQYANGQRVRIGGLWALETVGDRVYFAAGPNAEQNGIFGYLTFSAGACVNGQCQA